MAVRWTLAALVVIGSGLCGRAFAASAERRLRLLREMLDALRRLKIQIVNLLEPLDSALTQTGFPLFESVAAHLDAVGNAADAWQAAIGKASKRGQCADCLARPEMEAMERLFERLGESGRADQEEGIRACIASLELACEEARRQSRETGRLYTSVGILTGLALAVLMI